MRLQLLLINTEVLSKVGRSTFVKGICGFMGLANFCDFCPREHQVLRCLRNTKTSSTKKMYSQSTMFLQRLSKGSKISSLATFCCNCTSLRTNWTVLQSKEYFRVTLVPTKAFLLSLFHYFFCQTSNTILIPTHPIKYQSKFIVISTSL